MDTYVAGTTDVNARPLGRFCLAYSSSRPHATQNLIALYNLNPVAASVARKDPITGEKINKLRKSYEGHIKTFGLSGRPKATPTDGSLLGLVEYPDEEWHIQKEMGNTDILKGQLPSAAQAKLDRALVNIPISTKGSRWNEWRSLIGTDDNSRGDKPDGAKNGIKPHGSAQSPPGSAKPSGASTPNMGPKGHRPERTGTKRRYNDGSFEGYGEGFGDDDLGDSADDGVRNGLGKKKRRKVGSHFISPSTLSRQSRQPTSSKPSRPTKLKIVQTSI
jgi:hypothetical protein